MVVDGDNLKMGCSVNVEWKFVVLCFHFGEKICQNCFDNNDTQSVAKHLE